RGSTQGRVRRLPGGRRLQQAVSLQDPRAVLRPSPGDGLHVQGPYAGRRFRGAGQPRHRVRRGGPVSASNDKAIEIAQRQLDAYNAQDLDTYVSYFTE